MERRGEVGAGEEQKQGVRIMREMMGLREHHGCATVEGSRLRLRDAIAKLYTAASHKARTLGVN